ncbi:MAG: hypothetical protein HLUCCX21_00700 [Porphyrobacter sp. HL-46]|nr:MAG: hypothetical protein HLUCCX21_00700 [Porphyrobacter sp. HL-46]
MANIPVEAEFAQANPFDIADAAETLRLVTGLDRAKVEALAEVSIAYLDQLDGDTDREGGWSEDDITDEKSRWLRGSFGPGCDMSDPGD